MRKKFVKIYKKFAWFPDLNSNWITQFALKVSTVGTTWELVGVIQMKTNYVIRGKEVLLFFHSLKHIRWFTLLVFNKVTRNLVKSNQNETSMLVEYYVLVNTYNFNSMVHRTLIHGWVHLDESFA